MTRPNAYEFTNADNISGHLEGQHCDLVLDLRDCNGCKLSVASENCDRLLDIDGRGDNIENDIFFAAQNVSDHLACINLSELPVLGDFDRDYRKPPSIDQRES